MKTYRKRYMYITITPKEQMFPSSEELIEALERRFTELFGLTHLYLSRLKLEKRIDETAFILSVNLSFLQEAVAAVTLVGRTDGERFILNILGIESTIRGLINKVK